jgi:hypothetical protein
LPGPTTEVLNEDIKLIQSDLKRVEIGVAELRVEFRTAFRFMTGVTSLMLVTIIGGILAAIWWAATINADVRNLKGDVTEIKQSIRELSQKVGGNDVQKRP